jgi:hypothetical protein
MDKAKLEELMNRTMLCQCCRERKPRLDFVVSLDAPDTNMATCRQCNLALIASPKKHATVLTNMLANMLQANDYDLASRVVTTLIESAIENKDMKALTMILDRVDGPVKQKVEVDMTHQDKLVQSADELLQHLRKPNQPTKH